VKEILLKVKNLKVQFSTYRGLVTAVDGISFDLYKGDTLGLIGETGCGKSVTALSILRLIESPGRIVSGEIIFEGKDILKMKEKEIMDIRGNKISMVFQDPTSSLDPVFTIKQQMSEKIRGLHKKDAKKKIGELLRSVELSDPKSLLSKYPHQLSGGMRQRVMIAMALSCNPSLLIADEPTTALDVTVQYKILKLMNKLKGSFSTSILFITHNLGVAAQNCNRVVVMHAGKIMEMGDTKSVFKKRTHPYTKGLLKALPDLAENKSKPLYVIKGNIPSLINPPSGCRFHPRCPHVMEICKKEEPQLKEVDKNHYVACHLYGGE